MALFTSVKNVRLPKKSPEVTDQDYQPFGRSGLRGLATGSGIIMEGRRRTVADLVTSCDYCINVCCTKSLTLEGRNITYLFRRQVVVGPRHQDKCCTGR